MAAILTKCIYDCSFLRYDAIAPVPAALEPMVKARQTVQFQSGKNTLTGYLYEGEREGLVVLIPGFRAGADDYLWQIQSLLDHGWAYGSKKFIVSYTVTIVDALTVGAK